MKSLEKKKDLSFTQIKELETILKYTFSDKNLLSKALLQSGSVQNQLESNERMEFLGDRVLALAIAEILHTKFCNENEGDLSYRLTSLVRADSLELVANNLRIEKHIQIPAGEIPLSSQRRKSILSNTCEAIIAAIFLDGGYETVLRFIRLHWQDLINKDLTPQKDPKTLLQEWAQSRKLPIPNYKTLKQIGPDHNPEFTVEVSIATKHLQNFRAKGMSKRLAETHAAILLLDAIKLHEGN